MVPGDLGTVAGVCVRLYCGKRVIAYSSNSSMGETVEGLDSPLPL